MRRLVTQHGNWQNASYSRSSYHFFYHKRVVEQNSVISIKASHCRQCLSKHERLQVRCPFSVQLLRQSIVLRCTGAFTAPSCHSKTAARASIDGHSTHSFGGAACCKNVCYQLEIICLLAWCATNQYPVFLLSN